MIRLRPLGYDDPYSQDYDPLRPAEPIVLENESSDTTEEYSSDNTQSSSTNYGPFTKYLWDAVTPSSPQQASMTPGAPLPKTSNTGMIVVAAAGAAAVLLLIALKR